MPLASALLSAAVLVLGLAAVPAGAGASAPCPAARCAALGPCLRVLRACPVSPAADTHPRVRPRRGTPSTVFRVRLTARTSLGLHGGLMREYSVSASGHRRRGCAAVALVTLAAGPAGTVLHAVLRAGKRWCPGAYRGAVTLLGGPHCDPGTPCPAFALAPVPAGRFGFSVR
ncbi:MAG: hypothetical protein NVSMB51_10500 [Solirubrobacteraceae bacterium]